MIRNGWPRFVTLNWKLGIVLLLFVGILRFGLVIHANVKGDFRFVSIIFVFMVALPLLLLNRQGLKHIGLLTNTSGVWMAASLFSGFVLCIIVFLIGLLLYGKTSSNWFVSIGQAYPIAFDTMSATDKPVYFIIYSIIGMTFSPLGEEFMYRGLVHQCLAERWGDKTSTLIESGAFGVTHLAHFGIVYAAGSWSFLLLPGLLWIILIFGTGLIFNFWRRTSGSLYGAVLCHAAFNLAMTYFIFYQLF
ncbi:MAG: type II CAAX endopeptidase family protein [Cytophagales bacterium]|nr:type II CAAX endopeptidase family protein [Cytophagales bacterium]